MTLTSFSPEKVFPWRPLSCLGFLLDLKYESILGSAPTPLCISLCSLEVKLVPWIFIPSACQRVLSVCLPTSRLSGPDLTLWS